MNAELKTIDLLLEEDLLPALCNVVAYLYEITEHINWLGFYFFKAEELILGPFQGKVACTRIPVGKGVCGTSFSQAKTLNIKDVHQFEGHIACDSASNSELVIPLIYEGIKYGVLDIDSPQFHRFHKEEEAFFEEAAKRIARRIHLK